MLFRSIVVMNKGRVVQVGTPRDIYYQPKTDFVAEFVGTINRIRGVLRGDRIECAAGYLPWSAGGSGEIEVLFRPEDATLAAPEEACLKGRVVTSFFLGDRTKLILDGFGSREIVIETTDRREFEPGTEIAFRVDPNALISLKG